MAPIKEVVADPEWQAIRKSMVGTWMEWPVTNVRTLQMYLGDFKNPLKLRRVHNYLTGSGFRTGKITHYTIQQLLERVRAARTQGGNT